MEFRHLKTFRMVADCLNFTKAAEKLFLAQSSVSAQIKSLEDELGIRLFDRIGKSVLLTDAGEKLYGYARRMEDMTDEIKSEVSNHSTVKGSLNIRVPETIASIYMPAIIEDFYRRNPDVKLSFINCTDRQLKEELNTGRIDLAFLMTDTVHFEGVNVRFLKTEKLGLVCAPSHPLTLMPKVTLKDLEKHPLLMARTD